MWYTHQLKRHLEFEKRIWTLFKVSRRHPDGRRIINTGCLKGWFNSGNAKGGRKPALNKGQIPYIRTYFGAVCSKRRIRIHTLTLIQTKLDAQRPLLPPPRPPLIFFKMSSPPPDPLFIFSLKITLLLGTTE
jgi:hypothetical protein